MATTSFFQLFSLFGVNIKTPGAMDDVGKVLVIILGADKTVQRVFVFATKSAFDSWLASNGEGEVDYQSLLAVRQMSEIIDFLPAESKLRSFRFRGDAAKYFAMFAVHSAYCKINEQKSGKGVSMQMVDMEGDPGTWN